MSKGTKRLTDKTKHLNKEKTKRLDQDKFRAYILTDISEGILINDRYEVIEILSQKGGEADILLCEDTKSNNQKVVVKLYRGNFQPKTEILDELKGINHEDIIGLFDYNSWNKRFYEVMEYAEGGSLAEKMPFKEDYLIKIIIPEVTNALKFIHSKGIVHRDIKPTNIFYRNQNKTDIVIGDFGISSVLHGQSLRPTSGSGTHEFSAPELFTGFVSKETDFYSFGITLLFLITGKSPFLGMTPEQTWQKHVSEKIDLPENCSGRFKMLLQGLLTKERKNRWGTEEVERWLRGESVKVIEDQLGIREFYYKLDETLEANTIKELAQLLYENPKTAKEHVGRGYISRAIENYDQSLAVKISTIQESAKSNHLAYLEIIYTLDPTLPYRLDEYHEVKEPEELALQIDENSETWQIGRQQLFDDSILVWLKTIGYEHILENWNNIKHQFESEAKQDQGLENFLHIIKPDLKSPKLNLSHNEIKIRGIQRGKSRQISIKISNIGRGYLYGTIELSKSINGVALSENVIEASQMFKSKSVIDINIDTNSLPPGKTYSTNLILNTNADQQITIPFSFQIVFPVTAVLKECATWGFAGGLAALLLRLILSVNGREGWLQNYFSNYISWKYIWNNMVDRNFGEGIEFAILFLLAIILPIGFLIYKARKD